MELVRIIYICNFCQFQTRETYRLYNRFCDILRNKQPDKWGKFTITCVDQDVPPQHIQICAWSESGQEG